MSGDMSAAEKLRQKHEADIPHRPILEDVLDEEDILHPPPSQQSRVETSSQPILEDNIASATESNRPVALEPHPVVEREPPSQPARHKVPSQKAKETSLNTQSDELFPALGKSAHAPVSSQNTSAWGSKKPSSVRNGINGINGVNGNGHISSLPSSGSSTPISGVLTPASSNTPVRGPSHGLNFPQKMQLPGKHVERIQFAPSQLRPAKELKKPLAEIVRDINRRSKAQVEVKTGPNRSLIFEGRGPVDATRQVLKDLAKEVGSIQHIKVPVPLSVRAHIIGRQGTTIQNIQRQTGAKIQLPKSEMSNPKFLDDDSQTIDVTIEGDACAAELARREIENIAKARASNVNIHLREIPPELFPFLAGPHNCNVAALEEGRQIQIHIPKYHTWSSRAPPQSTQNGSPPHFVPCANHSIKISGDRYGAQAARSDLERQAQDLAKRITLAQIPIDQGRHQFILEASNTLDDFLQETGCAVVLPPRTADTETLTVSGPADQIESATEKIIDLASAMQSSRIDIARLLGNPPVGSLAQAQALTRYLQRRRAIEQLEEHYHARVVLPSHDRASREWEVFVRDTKAGIRAKQDIHALIAAHPPSRFRHVEVDPFFHQHIHDRSASLLQTEYGVHILDPRDSEPSSHLVLVYEGSAAADTSSFQLPRQAPSQADYIEFEKNLALAQQAILRSIDGQEVIRSTTVPAPLKYHDKVRKFVTRQQSNIEDSQIPLQIHFASPDLANDERRPAEYQGILRGPGNVDELAVQIVKFIENEKRDEQERGHVTSFDFPQKHMSHLIGKRGENVGRLRDEYDVDIQTKEGSVNVIGPKAKAELAKNHILAMARQLEDESTHVLIIPAQYHRDIIGAKGAQVNRLQDRYSVRINFPRSNGVAGEERPNADDASEISVPRNRRPNQGPNEVIVKGPSRGANAARDELLELLKWTQDVSHTSTVSVAQAQLPSLIGSGGQELDSLRMATGAQVDIPGKESADPTGRVEVKLRGTKKQVEDARKIIEQKSKEYDNTVTKSIEIDQKHHKSLIGSGGATIRNIVVAAGGADDRRSLARTVRFPPQGSTENLIRVEGSRELVDKVISAIELFTSQRENQEIVIVDVAPEKHRLLIGHGGEIRKGIESRFQVELNIPRLSDEGPARSQVKIIGQPADIERAKAHVQQITQDLAGESILIPRKYHHTISDNGSFFRRLRNNHSVTVNHGDQKPPPKPSPAAKPASSEGAAMPLITDDPDSTTSHSFTIQANNLPSSEEGTIPWVLRGNPDSIAKARAALEKALKQAEAQQSETTGYLVLADPTKYKYVIGQGGSKINEMRRQTGCKITVPKANSEGGAIEIIGNRDGVEEARDLILDAVSGGGRKMSEHVV